MTSSSDDARLSGYDFELPPELIAQEPAASRDGSRLLVLDRASGAVSHRRFRDIRELLRPGDLLVMNDTRVRPARARGLRAKTGGKAEVLFLEPRADGTWDALLGTRGKPEDGERFDLLDGALAVELVSRGERGFATVRAVDASADVGAILAGQGVMPLPPYIKRDADDDRHDADRERYQTVFAGDEAGAVAAPTAGLHFTDALLDELRGAGVRTTVVTLHVGLGTFQPVEVEDLADHVMHEEWFSIPEETARLWAETRDAGGRVVAVGTTSIRSLESALDDDGRVQPGPARTDLFLRPPATIHSIDALLTNFHLPKSTLLMLVSCLVGRESLLAAYGEAVREGYRFFSYGDAMLVT